MLNVSCKTWCAPFIPEVASPAIVAITFETMVLVCPPLYSRSCQPSHSCHHICDNGSGVPSFIPEVASHKCHHTYDNSCDMSPFILGVASPATDDITLVTLNVVCPPLF